MQASLRSQHYYDEAVQAEQWIRQKLPLVKKFRHNSAVEAGLQYGLDCSFYFWRRGAGIAANPDTRSCNCRAFGHAEASMRPQEGQVLVQLKSTHSATPHRAGTVVFERPSPPRGRSI